jgi:hypothetical protein
LSFKLIALKQMAAGAETSADLSTPAANSPLASHLAGVAIEGRQADQGRDSPARQSFPFRHFDAQDGK